MGTQLPQSSAHICCGQMAAWIKMSLGMELGLGSGEFVLNGDPAPPAHVYCGQTAGWMKVVLGMEVGLSPGDFVLDGDPVPFPQKGAEPFSPIFGSFLFWPNGSMHQNATWYGCWPQPRGLSVRWRLSPPSPTKGAEPPPNFWPISIVPKWLDASRCHPVWR